MWAGVSLTLPSFCSAPRTLSFSLYYRLSAALKSLVLPSFWNFSLRYVSICPKTFLQSSTFPLASRSGSWLCSCLKKSVQCHLRWSNISHLQLRRMSRFYLYLSAPSWCWGCLGYGEKEMGIWKHYGCKFKLKKQRGCVSSYQLSAYFSEFLWR